MEEHSFGTGRPPRPQRPLLPAMRRGFVGRCPACGEGRLFASFLKTAPQCERCGTAFHHHRADDLPAYLVIFVVGHVVVAGFMGVERAMPLALWQHLAIWGSITVFGSLALLQPFKGAVVGLQWAFHMHGFDDEEEPAPPDAGT